MKNYTIILAIFWASTLVSGFFIPIILPRKRVENESGGIPDNQSVLPHTAQVPLSGNETLPGNRATGGIVNFAHNILKSAEKGVAQVLNIGESFLNRNGTDQALDLEPEYLKHLPDNLNVKDYFDVIKPESIWCVEHYKLDYFISLAEFENTDKCCREHASCEHNTNTEDPNYGDPVIGPHCACHHAFYRCLEYKNNVLSGHIAISVAEIVDVKCLNISHPNFDSDRRSTKIEEKTEKPPQMTLMDLWI